MRNKILWPSFSSDLDSFSYDLYIFSYDLNIFFSLILHLHNTFVKLNYLN